MTAKEVGRKLSVSVTFMDGEGNEETVTSKETAVEPVEVTVAFGAASYTAAEGGAAAAVGVRLSADPLQTVAIPLTATEAGGAEAGDYTLSARSVTFESGETEKSLTVTAVDDAVDDDGVDDHGERVALGFEAAGLPAGVTVGSVTSAVVGLEGRRRARGGGVGAEVAGVGGE